jgi:hypothetical protein
MLSGDFKEKAMNKITLEDTPVVPFLTMLRYIYFGKLTLSDYSEEVLVDTLRLANYYQMDDLVDSIVTYFFSTMSVENVGDRLEVAMLLGVRKLEWGCLRYIDVCAGKFFNHESFLGLQQVRQGFSISNSLKSLVQISIHTEVFRCTP